MSFLSQQFKPLQLALGKICVAVAGGSPGELFQRSAALLPRNHFQELRLDYLPHPGEAIAALRAHVQAFPEAVLLATCRRRESGGRSHGSAADELSILLAAAEAGARLVDLSLESAEALPADAVARLRATGAVVILSWHDFNGPGDLAAVLDRMRCFAPDLYKVVPTAARLADNLPLLDLFSGSPHEPERQTAAEQAHALSGSDPGRIVGIAMGEAGVVSRILGVHRGSPFTFAAASAEEATAPGQFTAETLRALYRLENVSAATRLYGVAGSPIRSSLSPLMLNTAFQEAGVDAVYLPLLTNSAEELLEVARALPLAGFSVTMPLKQAVMPLLDSLDPLAARLGAVNTVVRQPDGSLRGYNTDAAGIVVPLERRVPLQGARVLVLGAGGAARAAVFGCAERGASVSVLNRTAAAAEALAAQAGASAITRDQLSVLPTFDVLINATPAGMRSNATDLPLNPEDLTARLVFDLVYNPLETPLLRAARALGLETISGVEMFVHQGARQFELWTGTTAPVAVMQRVVLEALSAAGR